MIVEVFLGPLWDFGLPNSDNSSQKSYWNYVGQFIHEHVKTGRWICNMERQNDFKMSGPSVQILVAATVYDLKELLGHELIIKDKPRFNNIFSITYNENTVENPFKPPDYEIDYVMKFCNGMRCGEDDCWGCKSVSTFENCDRQREIEKLTNVYDIEIINHEDQSVMSALSIADARLIKRFLDHFALKNFGFRKKGHSITTDSVPY